MQILKNKKTAILIAIFLMLSMSASTMLTPNASAHSPPWTIISYAYMTIAPTTCGVGQQIAVVMWIDTPLPGAVAGNPVRRADYTLTITKPDGTVTTQTWPFVSDSTGVQYTNFVPDQVGNYTMTFSYPKQTYIWNSTNTAGLAAASEAYYGDVFTADSTTKTIEVQQTAIPEPINSYPMPTEYWTRPIEQENTYWYAISSNWLSFPYIGGGGNQNQVYVGTVGGIQPDGLAPNSAHIMWTKPIEYGGLVGGNDTNVSGEAYYQGGSYNARFANPIIMQGTLFFQLPYGNSGSGGAYVAWDLRTGQQLWSINASATGVSLVPSFGYIYSQDQPNQHGAIPNGALIASTTSYSGLGTVWRSYDPRTGVLTALNVTNVPTGLGAAGPAGEYLKYVLTNYGNSTNPKWYLAQWNSSNVMGNYIVNQMSSAINWYTGTVNASLPTAYDWNVSVPLAGTGWTFGPSAYITYVDVGNMLLATQGTFGGHVGDLGAGITTDPGNITAISLKPQTLGQVMWTQTYPPASDNNTRTIAGWDPTTGVLVFKDKETFAHWGYSLTTGNLLWGPVYPPSSPASDWNFFTYNNMVINGYIYDSGYGGVLYCYNDTTGKLLWTYGNGGEGNSTNAGFETAYGVYPIFTSALADGKIYLTSTEHSPNSPSWKNALLRCLNATTGEEMWTILDYGNAMAGGISAIADGYLATLNTYMEQVEVFGRGPSQLTVTAPQASIELGRSLVISGMVTDISAGTKQDEQAARFPNGVPAVSDASQSAWMEYVYMQKSQPTDAIGVPVTISVVDANGNNREIGTTTSTADGFFTFSWKPDIAGQYTVYASFPGSESYWPSHAVTSFVVDTIAPTSTPFAIQTQSTVDMYFVPAVVGIIVAIAIGFAITIIVLRKRP